MNAQGGGGGSMYGWFGCCFHSPLLLTESEIVIHKFNDNVIFSQYNYGISSEPNLVLSVGEPKAVLEEQDRLLSGSSDSARFS